MGAPAGAPALAAAHVLPMRSDFMWILTIQTSHEMLGVTSEFFLKKS